MDVALIRWPADEARRADLAGRRQPRLLLVEPDADPPVCGDVLEDWVRLPASSEDVKARANGLVLRNGTTGRDVPAIDSTGLLSYRSRHTRLSPVQARLVHALVSSFGAVIGRESLAAEGWPGGVPSTNTVDVAMMRLRRRVEPLGLRVRTVRSRGYLLEGHHPGQ